ncbi:MAG: hypothetical protein IT184_18115 [Acidobacteria bacterium]|nr:hypothetical protein [Acidobacteriota bacterium]
MDVYVIATTPRATVTALGAASELARQRTGKVTMLVSAHDRRLLAQPPLPVGSGAGDSLDERRRRALKAALSLAGSFDVVGIAILDLHSVSDLAQVAPTRSTLVLGTPEGDGDDSDTTFARTLGSLGYEVVLASSEG